MAFMAASSSVLAMFVFFLFVGLAQQERQLRNYYVCRAIDASLVNTQVRESGTESVVSWGLVSRQSVDGYIVNIGEGTSTRVQYEGSWAMYATNNQPSSSLPPRGWVLVSQETGTLTAGSTYEFKLTDTTAFYQYFTLIFSPAVQLDFFLTFSAALCAPTSPFPIPAPAQLFSRSNAPQ